MNLATRCSSCGTVFRVAEEQLQASEGWVRCGRCHGVFNAADVLFDIDTGQAVRLAMPAIAGDAPPATVSQVSSPVALDPVAAGRASGSPLLRAPSREPDDDAIVITDHVPAVVAPGVHGADVDSGRPGDAPAPAGFHPAPAAGAEAGAADPAHPRQQAPSFIRAADRAAMWRRPAMRLALWAGVLLLGMGMLLQITLLWRDTLAAQLPNTTPALQALCRLAGCSVQPLRRIQLLAVESSGLNRLEGSPYYRLQLLLRNRADTPVMMPALDLALTDPQGQLVARRVLPAAELGVVQKALQPGQDLPIQVLMAAGDRRVAGYTLELFYP